MQSTSNSAFFYQTFSVLHLAENIHLWEGSVGTGSRCLLLSVGAAVVPFLEFDKGEGLASTTRSYGLSHTHSVQLRHKKYNANDL